MESSEGADRPVRLDDADFSGTRLHSPNFEGSRITDGWLRNADISGYIEGLRVNGVEVAPLIEAELDRCWPARVKLRSTDPAGLAEGWDVIEDVWRATVERARKLPGALLSERVDDDWSFVETLRHLISATDGWLLRMVRQLPRPYHPYGLAPPFLTDTADLGIDPDAHPSMEEVLVVRREHMDMVRETIDALTADELGRMCEPPDASGYPTEAHSVLKCLHVILDEEWEHSRYANRDLAILEARSR